MKMKNKSIQGTAALLIGVVFVVIAGLIFATTTWHTLPNIYKAIMALGFSVLFFVFSELARKVFRIEKTSQAFYILGSVFLFITVLAAGYFRLLGSGFTMDELCRFRVLCVGSIVTELALLGGIKRFADRIYTKACIIGLSVIAYFLLRALNLDGVTSINAMVIYSFGLILLDALSDKGREVLPEYLNGGFSNFAKWHFLAFSAILVMRVSVGFWIKLIVFLFTGKMQLLLSTVLALGAMTAGLTVIALQGKKLYLNILRSISMVMFVHYLGMWLDVDFIYMIFTSALLSGILFLVESHKKNPLRNGCVKGIYTLALLTDTGLVMLIALAGKASVGTLSAASAAILLVAAAAAVWGRKYSFIRYTIPVLLCPITMSLTGLAHQAGFMGVSLELVMLLFLVLICVWDLKQKDRFMMSILVLGTIAELRFWAAEGSFPLFAICLAIYLLIKSYLTEGEQKEEYEKGGWLYLLMGTFFVADRFVGSNYISLLCATAVYVVEYILFYWRGKIKNDDLTWIMAGLIFFLCDMTGFYLDDSLSAIYILPSLIVFVGFYILLYKRGKGWMHLLAALWIMPMPAMAAVRYEGFGHQLYGFTALAILLTGILIQHYVPLVAWREEDGKVCNCNWFNMLVIIVIFPMTILAEDGWKSVYLLMMALYVLQYIGMKPLRKGALTLAAALTLLALWTQSWIKYPAVITLEIQLALAVLFIQSLTYIWESKKILSIVQVISYCMCLAMLVVDAVRTGMVADALILEAVCLIIFVWATIRKHILWQRISSSIIVGVVLYMTKAFWLSLSWWVYLLVAGIGLIVFAAVNEMKKR